MYISLIIVVVLIGLDTYKCTHNENYLYYGNKNYQMKSKTSSLGTKSNVVDA